MKKIIIYSLTMCGLWQNTFSQALYKELDNYLEDISKQHFIPGFAIVVVKKGNIAFSKGYGVERLGSAKPFTVNTVAAIGSLTKSITAYAMMELVDEKRIDLDQKVVYYLPWFRTANKFLSDKITVRMLLDNTSGLYTNQPFKSTDASDSSLEHLVRSLSSTFLIRDPGISYEYSNVGFSVAGLVVSKISRMPYQKFLEEKIFRPLGMNHSSTDPAQVRNLHPISGHYYGIENPIPAETTYHSQLTEYIPAGSTLTSTVIDIGRYLIALMNTENKENEGILSQQSRNQMWQQYISFPGVSREEGGDGGSFGYGLGWMISTIDGRRIIHHGGSTGRTSSYTMIDRENETAICILMNIDLVFINSYLYPSILTISNNILRLSMQLSKSEFGKRTRKDPTLNDYNLPDSIAKYYLGNYFLETGGDDFVYYGIDLTILKNKNGQLEAMISRENQQVSRFMLDFINSSLSISRNLAFPEELRFRLTTEGKVKDVVFKNMVFKIEQNHLNAAYIAVHSENEKMAFAFPKSWKIIWNGPGFRAKNVSGNAELSGEIYSGFDEFSPELHIQRLWGNQLTIIRSGDLQRENIGNHVWKQKSFLLKFGGSEKEVIVTQTNLEGNNCYIVLLANMGNLTHYIQEVLQVLIRSLKIN